MDRAIAGPVSKRLLLPVGLVILIFFVDINLPLGIAGSVPYVFPVLLSIGASSTHATIFIAILASVLTVAAHFLSPEGSVHWIDIVNRVLALLVIWVTAILLLARRRAQEARVRMEQLAASRERLALLGELAAGVAHEFRNPLDGVMNCVKLLAPVARKDAASREILELAEEALQRMDSISARMLKLGREETIRREATQVEEMVQAVVRQLQHRASRERVSVQVRIEPDLPPIEVDQERMAEALANLVSNAIDATRPGGQILVEGMHGPSPGSHVLLRIADHGHGVPEAVRERIFEPFFTTKPEGKGSGLGLAIARRIIENHGGKLELSEARDRTEFEIRLPLKAETNAQEALSLP